MSRSDLLRIVADRGDGKWTLPAAVDGLRTGETPTLYFHDVDLGTVGPWLERFDALPLAVTAFRPATPDTPAYRVTAWRGMCRETPVEIRLYRVAP